MRRRLSLYFRRTGLAGDGRQRLAPAPWKMEGMDASLEGMDAGNGCPVWPAGDALWSTILSLLAPLRWTVTADLFPSGPGASALLSRSTNTHTLGRKTPRKPTRPHTLGLFAFAPPPPPIPPAPCIPPAPAAPAPIPDGGDGAARFPAAAAAAAAAAAEVWAAAAAGSAGSVGAAAPACCC
jgi:hypothetical protein